MKTPLKVARLAKFLTYILGHRPDEFGLLPDEDGFVKMKDLLKAVGEEEGWGYVRRSHIREVLLTCNPAVLEIDNQRIRAANRDHLPAMTPVSNPPKVLYTCIRRRAYPRVHARGIHPAEGTHVVLTTRPELALRIGRRKDPDPVLLAVNTTQSELAGSVYLQFGESLYAADFVAAETFTGPPLPKERPAPVKPPTRDIPRPAVEPGSFRLDPERLPSPRSGPKERRKDVNWKRERRQQRRHKHKKMWEG